MRLVSRTNYYEARGLTWRGAGWEGRGSLGRGGGSAAWRVDSVELLGGRGAQGVMGRRSRAARSGLRLTHTQLSRPSPLAVASKESLADDWLRAVLDIQ